MLFSKTDNLLIFPFILNRLYRLVDGLLKPAKFSAMQKSVFLFLKHLQTHCYYLEVRGEGERERKRRERERKRREGRERGVN